MRKFVELVMALAMAVVLTLAPQTAAANRVWPIYGARGDAQVTVACPDGEALVGFDGRTGDYIDQVQLMCAVLLPDGNFGAPHAFGDPIGGTGGVPRDSVTCPLNARMHELRIVLNSVGKQIQRLSASCMDSAGNVTYKTFGDFSVNVDPTYGSENSTYRLQSCPQEYITALGITFGQHVNGVGVICNNVDAPPAAASSRPPPLKSTGHMPKAPTGSALVPREAFAGKWRTVTSSNGHFDIYLSPAGNAPSEVQLPIIGQFVNTDDAHEYDGTLQGSVPPNSQVLIYSFTQKNGAAGTGTFVLSNDGSAITGEGTTSDGQKFTWNGTRTQ